MAERDLDRVRKQLKPGDWAYLENEAEGGCIPMPCYSIVRPNEYRPPSSSTNIPTRRMPSGPSHVTHPLFPESSSSTVFPFNTLAHDHYVNQQIMQTEQHSFLGSVGNERGFHKRKWTSMPIENDPRNTSGHSLVGKSSSNWHQHPISDCLHLHQEFESTRYNTPGTESSRQGSRRNVRCRHSHQNEEEVARRHFSTTFPSHPLGNLPGPGSQRQWNHDLASAHNGKAPFSDRGASTSEMNASYFGSGCRNGPHVGNGLHRHSTPFRNFCSALSVHGHAQTPGASSSNHSQRVPSSWRPVSSFYVPSELAPSYSDGNEQSVHEDISRRSMSISIGGSHRSSGRSGRLGDSFGRHHSVPIMTNTHGRWMPPRGYTAIGQGIYFDSSITLDPHENMRLDVDNMSYEELLDLGERIGNVNTGLSEDVIIKCLTRIVYSCPSVDVDEILDAKNCAICLENYKVGEGIGRLKCRHEYHFCCIQKWLEIKNSCPICKASALEK